MSEWIKCSEQLPEMLKTVLVYSKYSEEVFEAWLVKSDTDKNGDYFCDNYGTHYGLNEITHWQPLLETPKEI